MKRRLFIAINLPEEIKNKIEAEIEKFRYSFTNDIRFSERENWHMTVVFLGDQEDEMLGPIVEALQETARAFKSFFVHLDGIGYGPVGKEPRMIWCNGDQEASRNIGVMKIFLEDRLIERGVQFKREHRKPRAHITLARFRQAENLPDIERKLDLNFTAKSIELMESRGRPGTKYEVLQSTPLGI